MKRLCICVLLAICLCVGTVTAAPYADIDIYVSSEGIVDISGDTNDFDLLRKRHTVQYDSDAQVYLLNITSEAVFANYFFTLHLPTRSNIFYIKTATLSRIESTPSSLQLVGYGSDVPFELVVQYRVPEEKSYWWVFFIFGALAAIVIGYKILYLKKHHSPVQTHLPDRQRSIVDYLIKNGGSVSQSTLERALGLPKSSLSRNIAALERKKLIKKEPTGMTNIIILLDR